MRPAHTKASGMKITVYRRNGPDGYTEPVAFLGDESPPGEGWFVNAKADLSDAEHPPRLLMLGRAFLIYSMYHARDPQYLGYAVENFGAAVKKLGYTLPLKDGEASWLTYGPEGLDPGTPDAYQFMLGQVSEVFGPKAAQEQADELAIKWPSRIVESGGNGRNPSR